MRLSALALVTAVLSLVGCDGEVSDDISSSSAPPSFSMVHLDLTLPAADTLEKVSFSIQKQGLERSGSALVEDARQLRFRFGGLPAESAYRFSLAGTTRGGLPCLAFAGFDVSPGALTQLVLERTCSGKSNAGREGEVRVTVRIDQQDGAIRCAAVSGVSGAPLVTTVGEPIEVEGYTTSPTPVRWSSDAGLFAAPSAATTTFACHVPGTHELRFEATLPPICPASAQTLEVTCAPRASCGDGKRDAWEECDDGNDSTGDGCTPDCVREPFCVAGFPCALTGTAAFCTGPTQYRRARSAPCADVCGSSFCTGSSCMVTGEPFDCPPGHECVMDATPGSYTARCRRRR